MDVDPGITGAERIQARIEATRLETAAERVRLQAEYDAAQQVQP